MTTLRITNIYGSPYGAPTVAGTVTIGAGETRNIDVNDDQEKAIRENVNVWRVDGTAAAAVSDDELAYAKNLVASLSEAGYKLGAKSPDELPAKITDLIKERDGLRASFADVRTALNATSDEEVIAEISRLNDNATTAGAFERTVRDALGIGEGVGILETIASLKSQPTTAATKPTLAEAVAGLDDKNDAHWIDSGKPNIDVLKEITGGDVKRADVDAIGRTRKTA